MQGMGVSKIQLRPWLGGDGQLGVQENKQVRALKPNCRIILSAVTHQKYWLNGNICSKGWKGWIPGGRRGNGPAGLLLGS